jgi:hypothetical protein
MGSLRRYVPEVARSTLETALGDVQTMRVAERFARLHRGLDGGPRRAVSAARPARRVLSDRA